ncbi:MAG: DUF4920 domain-containing protein [Candidatus Poribacteria bacterium]|nr:DUF4920 domain-containing protein [Candidatus Poribacteria bacterium]
MNIRLATIRNSFFVFALASAALLIGCGKSGEKSYGKAVTVTETTSIADIKANPEEYHDKTVRIEGKITQVCQDHGCWFHVADETQQIKVDLEMHRSDTYTIPKNSKGKRSVIQGIVHFSENSPVYIRGFGNTIE